jgi:beta-lactamase class A
MRIRSLLVYTFVFIVLISCNKDPMKDLQENIKDELAKVEGDFAVAFKDLATGETLLIKEHESFHAASTMKTPVLIEVYKQASEGKFSLNDSITLKNEFKSIVDGSAYSLDVKVDSETTLYTLLGQKRTLGSLVYDMIIVSSNLATNLVIELVDAKKVTETLRAMGANDIKVLRGVEDSKAFDKGLNNSTTAFDLMLIFENMAQGKIVNQESCDAMIKILLDQKFNEIIPAKLPKDVKVAHKTGSITGVQHDSGIIFLPDGRKYVLVLLSKNLKDVNAGIAAMANVSEKIYQYQMRDK